MIALSIRQPWAWLIVHGHKPVENRTWRTNHRGPLLIHASAQVSRRDYEDTAAQLAEQMAITVPPLHLIERGGVVGLAELTDCVVDHDSPFWTGPYGFVLAHPKPLPFHKCPGALGFFHVRCADVGLNPKRVVGAPN